MSYTYQTSFIYPDYQTATIMGKRYYNDLAPAYHPAWQSQPCKRPRRMLTPGSVISAITQDSDSAKESPPSVYEHGASSPEYEPVAYIPSSNSAAQCFETPSPNCEPCAERATPPSQLRSDEDIQADVSNSFASGQCGTVGWTPELLIQVLATEVEELIHSNEDRAEDVDVGEYQTFYSSYKQPFELDFYMRRLVQYVNCSTAVFVTMFVYLDRVQERCKALLASDMNCHRLVFTCLILAVKYLEDEVHSNAYYARVGGLTVDEMNMLEVKLLQVLGWNLNVSPDTYAVFEEGMVQTAGLLLGGGHGGYGSPVSED